MKDTLVLTISIGDYYKKISKYTIPYIKKYADKIGADFLCISDHNKNYITQKWNKFHIYELLNKYKRIIYLDIDIIIRDDCPSLFDIVPENKLGMFNEGRYVARYEFLEQASEYYKEPLKKWKNSFYNSGVMVISRMHKQIFKMPRGIDHVKTDQPYINLRILNDGYEMMDLNYKFNRMSILDTFCGINRLDSYIVHYAGAPEDMIFDVMRKDMKQWKQDSPFYQYKRNILISATAGTGDKLCAEPAIRYTQKIYPDSNFILVTHFPRLFEHIEMPIFKYDEWKGINDAIYTMHTCPDDEQTEHKLSHVLFHPTDYASMSMIKRTIPNHDKTIKLKLDIEDVSNMFQFIKSRVKNKRLILVHCGKWWPSKTLPLEWWQEVVDKLSEKFAVGLIGKTIDDKQGYLPVNCPEDGIDFRDITTMGELIALISMAHCLLTNDSLPLHIGGAFNNWIVVIPTCKHPDHILPFRNGTQYYKTKALYKKLLLDDLEIRHTEYKTETIDIIPTGHDLYEYIPDVDTVVKEIIDIYKPEINKKEMNFYAEFDTDKIIRETYFSDYDYKGTMIEIGAGPPVFYSISKHFRDNGWRCVCIEPNPKFAEQHKENNNEIYQYACSNENVKESDFQVVDTKNWKNDIEGISFSAIKVKEEYKKINDYPNLEITNIKVEIKKLDTILEEINVNKIDLVSIDVEGWELEVMQGFNTDKYNPKIIILENYLYDDKYIEYMNNIGYILDKKIKHNYIFIKK